MSKFFLLLYDYFHTHKKLLFSLMGATLLLFLCFAVQIKTEEDLTSFFPKGKENEKASLVFKNLKIKDKIFVMLSLRDTTVNDPEKLIEAADHFTERLNNAVGETHISSITSGIDDGMMSVVTDYIYNNLPLFMTEEDYRKIDTLLTGNNLTERMEANYNNLISPIGMVLKEVIKKDPLSFGTGALKELQSMGQSVNYQIYNGRIFSSDLSTMLLMIDPRYGTGSTGKNEPLIDAIEGDITATQAQFGDLRMDYFGGPSVGVYNARQIKNDSILTGTIALIIIILFITFAFRNRWAILLILLPVVYGTLFSLAIIYLIQGNISSIAIGAGVAVFGIAMSYSIHVLSHRNHTNSIRQIIEELTSPLTIGSFTTIGAFIGLMFTSSNLLSDFGLFAALTMIGTTLFTLIFLPHMMKEQGEEKPNRLMSFIDKINGYAYDRNRWLAGFIAILLVVCFFKYDDVQFDSNMMNLSVQPENLKKAEERLSTIFDTDNNTIIFATVAENTDSALAQYNLINRKIEELQKRGEIKNALSANQFLIPSSVQKERIGRWNSYWTKEKRTELEKRIGAEATKAGFAHGSFRDFFTLLNKEYTPIVYTDDMLADFPIFKEWTSTSDSVKMFLTKVSIDNDRKDEVYSELLSKDLVILDRSHFANQMAVSVNDDFFLVLYISSFLIFFALLISYGRIELTLMAFVPMALSWVIILGLMAIFGLEFNIVNIILSTFIFGIGDDFSIFVMDGLLSEYRNGKKMLASHKTAIFFSVFTTIVGIGVLIFAKHPVLHSISAISILGMVAVVLISFTVQPIIFRIFITSQTKRGGFPFTFFGLLNSLYAFFYFITGCFLLQFYILILLTLPIKMRRKKEIFHRAVSWSTHFFLRTMITAKMVNINSTGETFQTPAVIISNHQSFIDILLLLGLYPKIVMVTNSWVWNSPFFGWIVRFADFYHTNDGYEASIPTLREKVADGYSILVFPEGTRSPDRNLKHFHKGAFYIAEKLELDIIPIVQFGNGLVSSKRQPFFIKKGFLVSKILPRIAYSDRSYGDTYQSRTKSIANYFKAEYELLCEEYGTAKNNYFYDALIKNYTYKGPVLEWYMRIKVKMEKNYDFFDRTIPRDATITDIGCGYAPLAFMLSMYSQRRTIVGLDYDAEKIEVANNSFLKTDRLTFVHANALNYDYDHCDVFILNDMLHYINHEAQRELIGKVAAKLNSGGMLIIRDGDGAKQKQHKVTEFTEKLSTKIFQFNKTEGKLYFTSKERIVAIAKENELTIEERENDNYTSNTIYILRRDE